MKYKIGEEVKMIGNDNKFIVAKTKSENINTESLKVLTIKTNILNLESKITNIELGNFDYLLIQSYPSPFPKEIEIPNYELVSIDDLQ